MFSASKTHLVITLPMVQLRAPTQPPSPLQHRQLQILFRHPGYDDDSNVLFKLQAPDTDDHGQPGLLAQFAIDACAIIAGDYAGGRGWLSLSRDGSASIDLNSTLRERSYYFHLGAVDDPYPIVPNFRQWKYPHDRLPPHWQQLTPDTISASSSVTLAPSNLTTALLMRDGSCRLSGCREQLQVAHVVPQSELDWWRVNDMSRYNTGSTATLDDTANALLLRADLHIAFDKPKQQNVYQLPVCYKVCCLRTESSFSTHYRDHHPNLPKTNLYFPNQLAVSALNMSTVPVPESSFARLNSHLSIHSCQSRESQMSKSGGPMLYWAEKANCLVPDRVETSASSYYLSTFQATASPASSPFSPASSLIPPSFPSSSTLGSNMNLLCGGWKWPAATDSSHHF